MPRLLDELEGALSELEEGFDRLRHATRYATMQFGSVKVIDLLRARGH
jgi:hypothetical protein